MKKNKKTKYEEGYTSTEVEELIKDLDKEKFYKELGVNTVFQINGETVYPFRDIDGAIHRVKTGEKQHPLLWD